MHLKSGCASTREMPTSGWISLARGDRGANPPDIDPPIIPRRLRLTGEMFERFGVDRYTSHVIFLMQFAQFISCTSQCMAQVSVRARHSILCHP